MNFALLFFLNLAGWQEDFKALSLKIFLGSEFFSDLGMNHMPFHRYGILRDLILSR
jgi:hypothetical protein